MDVSELLQRVSDHLSVGRAFGPSYERDGALVVPVAFVAGGGGGGKQSKTQDGEGGGFGGVVHPLGAYVVRDGQVRFVPTFDATILVVGVLSLLRLIVARRATKA